MESPRYDWLRRALRTFLQAFVGTLSVMAIPALNEIVRAIGSAEPYELNFDFWQSVAIAATLSGVVALISAAQNALEDKAGMPAVIKGKASSGQNPVPEPSPAVNDLLNVPRDQWGINRGKRDGAK